MSEKPKDKNGKLDKDKVKEMYMNSPFIEWTKFAESQEWNPHRSRTDFPVATWQEEKRQLLVQQMSEKIKEGIFEFRGDYHLKVIETLKIFPEMAYEMARLIKGRVFAIAALPSDQQLKIPIKEIMNLTKALDAVVTTTHRSLMLDRVRWTPDIAESDANSLVKSQDAQSKNQKWTIQVMGAEDLTSEQLAKLMVSYYDKPKL